MSNGKSRKNRDARIREERAKRHTAKQNRMHNPKGDSTYAAKVKAGHPNSPHQQAEVLATQPRPYTPPNVPVVDVGLTSRPVFKRTDLPSGARAVVGIVDGQVVFVG